MTIRLIAVSVIVLNHSDTGQSDAVNPQKLAASDGNDNAGELEIIYH